MRELTVDRDGVFALSRREDGWYWYLDWDGKPLVLICNACGTCPGIFEPLEDAPLPLTPEELSERLNQGFETLSDDVIGTVEPLLPRGRYWVSLLRLERPQGRENGRPERLELAAPRFWITRYQEFTERRVEEYHYEMLAPIIAEASMDPARVEHFKEVLGEGREPVVLALTVHHEVTPRGDHVERGLAHFILDGHHKVQAAGELGVPVTVLSFLYRGEPEEPWELSGDVEAYYRGGPLRFLPREE